MKHDSLTILKFGALGDVVRTSYFVEPLVRKYNIKNVTWITKPQSFDLLRFNPYINNIVRFGIDEPPLSSDLIVSLDDEFESVSLSSKISHKHIIGSVLTEQNISYTDSAQEWFDMGLLSKYGKAQADRLKKINQRSHAEIFSAMLGVDTVQPCFYGNNYLEEQALQGRNSKKFVLGINCFAGARWKSKEMPKSELTKLLDLLKADLHGKFGKDFQIWIFADAQSLPRASTISIDSEFVKICDTGRSVLDFAAQIKACDFIISTDSLGLHLAIAQKIPNISFYAPTSAAEIDTFGTGTKLISTSPDYCSYSVDADNSSITAERILAYFS